MRGTHQVLSTNHPSTRHPSTQKLKAQDAAAFQTAMPDDIDPMPRADESASLPEASHPTNHGLGSDISDLPDELPPVKPPSAGFIVQLFVVPALIVMAVVGVWALFGRMASSQQDWERLVDKLRSPNEQIQWRAALGLAQMLRSDQSLGENGQQLAGNERAARELAEMFDKQLLSTRENDENHFRQLQFLARTLGYFDTHEIVLPSLRKAMNIDIKQGNLSKTQQEADPENTPLTVKKNAIASVALIIHRANERKTPINSPELTQSLIDITFDEELLVRQMGTYALGLIHDEASTSRLVSLLRNADENTRANAAIGLARRNLTDGWPVFRELLASAAKPIDSNMFGRSDTSNVVNRRYLWLVLATVCAFIAAIWSVATEQRRSRMLAGTLCLGALIVAGWCIYGVAEVRAETVGVDEEQRRLAIDATFRDSLLLSNALKAIADLDAHWTETERAEAVKLTEVIAKDHGLTGIRVEARRVLGVLSGKANAD